MAVHADVSIMCLFSCRIRRCFLSTITIAKTDIYEKSLIFVSMVKSQLFSLTDHKQTTTNICRLLNIDDDDDGDD